MVLVLMRKDAIARAGMHKRRCVTLRRDKEAARVDNGWREKNTIGCANE